MPRLPDLERGQPLQPADVQQPEARGAVLPGAAQALHAAAGSSPPTCSTARSSTPWAKAFQKAVGNRTRDLGPAQLHRRQPLPHARHEGAAAARSRATSGSPRPAGSSSAATTPTVKLPQSTRHAAKATRYVFKLAALSSARQARVLLPLVPGADAERRRGTPRSWTPTTGPAPPTRCSTQWLRKHGIAADRWSRSRARRSRAAARARTRGSPAAARSSARRSRSTP